MKTEELLRHRISEHSDEELLTIVSINAADYREKTLDYVIEELTRRGIPFSPSVKIVPSSSSSSNDLKLVGFGGWLILLWFGITILSPLIYLFGNSYFLFFSSSYRTQIYNTYAALYAQSHIIFFITVGIAAFFELLNVGLVCFGIYAGIALWKIKDNAVKLTKIFLASRFIYAVILILLLMLGRLNSPSQVNNISDLSLMMGIQNLVYVSIWYAYLSLSKRVKLTYGKAPNIQ